MMKFWGKYEKILEKLQTKSFLNCKKKVFLNYKKKIERKYKWKICREFKRNLRKYEVKSIKILRNSAEK